MTTSSFVPVPTPRSKRKGRSKPRSRANLDRWDSVCCISFPDQFLAGVHMPATPLELPPFAIAQPPATRQALDLVDITRWPAPPRVGADLANQPTALARRGDDDFHVAHLDGLHYEAGP